ncbi:MAG TPA: hypothetical protein VNU93_09060, partial [Verrucomicrobiae bacterium]|nr:hypothetical protein [Verrucomicrobiae bacterium]
VSLKSRQLESKGRNIIGVLPGSDKNLKKETVVIGLSYNYRASEQGGREKVLLGLELVKKLAGQKEMRTRNIVVAFWDGTVSEGTNGLTHYTGNSQQDAVLYLDLTQVTGIGADNVVVFTQWAPVKNLFAWSLGHQLAANFNQSGIPVVDEVKDLSFTSSAMYYQKSIPTVMVAVPPSGGGKGKYPLSKLGEVLADSIKRNNY